MEESDLGIGINDFASDFVPKDNFYQKNKKLVFVLIFCLIVLFIVAILAIISVNLNRNRKEKDKENKGKDKNKIIGEIICTFNIYSIERPTKILSDEYKKTSEMKIFIDEKEIKYSKEYLFNSTGEHEVKIGILEDINLNNMFKEIYNLIAVNMTSDSNAKIISMESTFDNCKTLEKFYISGFDTKNTKSMKKLFLNTQLNKINISSLNTDNVIDMSHMFSFTELTSIDLSNFNFSKVENLSHFFKSCYSLMNIKFDNIDTSNVKDMSYMFSNCEALQMLDL